MEFTIEFFHHLVDFFTVDLTVQKVFEHAYHFFTVELFVVCGTDEKPGGWTSTLPNAVDWDEFLDSGSDAPVVWPRDLDETTAMGLCYTSGTTGPPPLPPHHHRRRRRRLRSRPEVRG